MREGWREYKLCDATSKINSGATPKGGKESYKSDGISLIRSLNIHDGSFRKKNLAKVDQSQAQKLSNAVVESGDVLLNITGASIARCCVVPDEFLPARVNQHVTIIRPIDAILDSHFLAYLLVSREHKDKLLHEGQSGSTRQALTKGFLKDYRVLLPPLPEQKRIVAILDEAFAGIDTAIANTEKNLTNAHELFKSYLNAVFSQRGDGWSSHKLSELGTITSSKRIFKSEYTESGVPFFRTKEIKELAHDHQISKTLFISNERYKEIKSKYGVPMAGDILLTAIGTIGEIYVVEKDKDFYFKDGNVLWLKNFNSINPHFLKYALRSFVVHLNRLSHGSAYSALPIEKLKQYKISVPNIVEQRKLVENIDDLGREAERLGSNYLQKLTALAELKQSLLQKAFSGELTAGNVVPITSTKKSSGPPTPDSPAFAAHIMAVAYHWHEARGKNKTFGHVKAQKTLHLLEALAQIDLGRAPVKDAAGPNDFAHMRTAEKWARENDYFDFVQRTEGQRGYDFVKGTRYSDWLARALDAVEPYKSALERVVSLLMPLDTQKAELVATVYAAWNNLLLDGHKPTEAEIVYEARDNWHPDKQQYTRQQFSEAIERLRSHGMVPTGTGKRVTGQESFEL